MKVFGTVFSDRMILDVGSKDVVFVELAGTVVSTLNKKTEILSIQF
jgi:hypothetical protein